MARYVGPSPFQDSGFVWANGAGYILTTNGTRMVFDKPDFSFDYDFVYCEPTLCHRTIGDDEIVLTESEIVEVSAWISAELATPLIVNGVDADGRYLEGVPETSVVRTVSVPPPSGGTWRFDFAMAAQFPGDHWTQAHCVDVDGNYIGNVDEGQWAALATVAPPDDTYGEDWRWNGSEWQDVRTEADKLAAAQTVVKELVWSLCAQKLEYDAVAVVNIGGTDHEFGADRETRENIIGLNTAIAIGVPVPNPRQWYPKGEIAPVDCSHADLAAIGGALLAVKDAYMTAYLTHKATIMTMTDAASVLAYDYSSGWPS